MAVKVLIKRTVPDGADENLMELLNKLRRLTMGQPGYISGETLRRADRPGENLVISTWESMDDWRKCAMSNERNAIQDEIDNLLGHPTEYEVYTH